MVRNEFEQQRLGRRPGQRLLCCRERPSLQIGKVRSQRPKGICAHTLVDQVAQRLDILIGQKLGEFVAPLHRQHGGDRVKFLRSAVDRVAAGACHSIDDAGCSFKSVCPKSCPLNKRGALAIAATA